MGNVSPILSLSSSKLNMVHVHKQKKNSNSEPQRTLGLIFIFFSRSILSIIFLTRSHYWIPIVFFILSLIVINAAPLRRNGCYEHNAPIAALFRSLIFFISYALGWSHGLCPMGADDVINVAENIVPKLRQ